MNINFRRAYADKAKQEFDNGIKYIKPTIFNKDYETNKVITSSFIDDINTEICFSVDKANTEQFIKIHPLLISNLLGKGETVIAVLGFFIQELRYNSNCVRATTDTISSTMDIGLRNTKEAIDYLCQKQVIAKTTIQSEYIINHNLLFKGSIEKFVKAYNKLYGGAYAKKDSKGKVIISKDIVNADKNIRWNL